MQLLSSRTFRAAAAGVAALGLFLTGCTAEPEFSYEPPSQVEGALPDDTVAAMEAAVANALAASGASGAVVGVWAPWSGSWVTGVGTQGPGSDEEISTDMAFRVADMTRLMTCDVLYGLADEGVVELDDLVPEYVSGVADMKDITLLDLCNSTSGAGSSEATAQASWFATPERVWAPLELASYGLGAPRATPKTTYTNSDAGYLLLGLALERASGLTASELIAEYVTKPLGLTATSLPSPAPAAPSTGPVMNGHYLTPVEGGYNCAAPTDITTLSSSTGYTDSGVVSTIDDLGRYAQAEAAQKLRTKDEPNRFGAPLPQSPEAPSWFQATGGALLVGSMIGQSGWTPGYQTSAFSDPASGFTVAVSLNDSTTGGTTAMFLAWELAAIASKAPAAAGETAPEFGLPFTAEQYHQAITDSAIPCVAPPAG
ncbi:serine hydrolase [Microbacterium sp. Leaf161]|uniref:serine hydrolase domain-containing protein n=1 Tax=Microbacterium sp. Leaf161 TaxID=1736281 RepID=UPI0006F67E59|nr:serine hydrolase domain-containing protein [Microbacterium sp. Leaf161]KQR48340.1 serine hydrolase [Microbacterium sp. Leaf161]